MKMLVIVLVLLNLAFAGYIYLAEARQARGDEPTRELNADQLRLLPALPAVRAPGPLATAPNGLPAAVEPLVSPPAAAPSPKPAQPQTEAPVSSKPLACVEWTGIAAADAVRARKALAHFTLGERLSERRIDEPTRYWVNVPPLADAEAAAQMVALFKNMGIDDVFAAPDHAISLGLYAKEETALRHLSQLEAKGVRGARITPRNPQLKEVAFIISEPEEPLVARLLELRAEFNGTSIKPMSCPG